MKVDFNNAETPPHKDDEIIKELAKLSPLDFDRQRSAKAKELGVQVKTLDTLVKAERAAKEEVKRLPFDEIEPCHEPIKPEQLLNEIAELIKQFIVLDIEQANTAALWVAHTWFIDVLEIAPLAIINAPTKSCGKTQLLTVLGRMVYRPLHAANASASALFRAVDLWKPTILIDEADTFFKDNAELHGMVNAGYMRDGFVLRSEAIGDSYEPRVFPVFSAKAIAGVRLEKHLPDTTMSRGIVFNLRRKLSHESVSRLRHAERNLFDTVKAKLARFANDYSQKVRDSRPELPDKLSDRNQDNWDGLLAVAMCTSKEWVQKAELAALKISGGCESSTSVGNELLADIQTIFENKSIYSIRTTDLIYALCEDEEAPWLTYNRGKPITARQVNQQLNAYGIKSKQIRANDDKIRGFEPSQFADVFERYLSEKDSCTRAHTPENIRYSGTKPQEVSNDAALLCTGNENRTRYMPVQEQHKHESVPDSTGYKNLSGTAQHIELITVNDVCTTVPDKNGTVRAREYVTDDDVERF